ncbi:MAG: benzoyl-CoA 2,3-epoxidase subunit BoxB [Streptosporangiaceae bacterium]
MTATADQGQTAGAGASQGQTAGAVTGRGEIRGADADQGEIVGIAPAPDGPVSVIDYSELIPNNVGLATDRRLQRALESWQPKFLGWWASLGPSVPTRDVYLRTAIAVGRDGWANFARVPMEQYRWGIFLSERDPDRRVGFGRHLGEPAWQEVPGEYRADLRRLLVVQGDTEPASVEQQRHLGMTAPSLYDMRNLFQVNVEEGRHLWAMVYLLHAYFGRDGRDEAEQLLQRNSGDPDKPRILGAFNEETTDWLSFFMFTYFTDRDGKYQLGTLKESGFDPLARTCEFMLREEAHHMFVGTTGVQRTVERTAALLKEHDTDDLWDHGAIPLSVIQKYLNFQFSVSLDLFGSETSSNVASYYTAGLKGRWMETRRKDDHLLAGGTMEVPQVQEGAISTRTVPLLTALNLDLRNEYMEDCARGIRRWNRELDRAGLPQRLTLPHEGFNRKVGAFAGQSVSPSGELLDPARWARLSAGWLPTAEDRARVAALMLPHYEPGEFASWIAPPGVGINDLPVEYDYVRF